MLNLKVNTTNNNNLMINQVSNKEVAIIGISSKLPLAENVNEFWNNLKNGVDCIRSFSEVREKDTNNYLKFINEYHADITYSEQAYLREIDKFDNDFFNISSKEASLMDPNQRLLLESFWNTIEDAGYNSQQMKGTKTGVFVGYTGGNDYLKFVEKVEPHLRPMAEAGNILSIIASRIAYILDLKGPSMLVDTACSSSLVAVYFAYQCLKNKECDMALVGGIKITLLPIKLKEKLGIESSTGKTRTFDEQSDGTGFGEGVVSLLLKPLYKAIQDKDNIYVVIKGGAVNQDGNSVGITAPNIVAQEKLLISAWEDANINPESISYIETHGTGTKLGDPIEVNAIDKAFKKYTNKKQFCGIGSVKSNIGHLDNVAGIVGLLKLVLSLQNHKIPPTLNFNHPNSKIQFENSAIYVNDTLNNWEHFSYPRRCGVSSFGLSGTNCHIVLEEYDNTNIKRNLDDEYYIYTLSAKEESVLQIMLQRSFNIIKNNLDEINDICYTMAVGRDHYNYRISIIVKDKKELLNKLAQLIHVGLKTNIDEAIYFNKHFISNSLKTDLDQYEIHADDIVQLNKQSNQFILQYLKAQDKNEKTIILNHICKLYIRGAEINWTGLFKNKDVRKVSLPGYSFKKKRNWLNLNINQSNIHLTQKKIIKNIQHPLLDELLSQSIDQDIYITHFNIDKHWVVREHIILNNSFPPGTIFLEMARKCFSYYCPNRPFEIKDVIYISPLIVKENEIKEVQTVIIKEKEYFGFKIISKKEDNSNSVENWEIYAEGKIATIEQNEKNYKIDELKNSCNRESNELYIKQEENTQSDFHFGPRWTKTLTKKYFGDNEVFVELKISDEFISDLDKYYLHPSLMDLAVNTVTQETGYGLYLPLSYKSIKMYKSIPNHFYSYVKIRNHGNNIETLSFDILLLNLKGELIGEINKFSIKKVNTNEIEKKEIHYFHQIKWIQDQSEKSNYEFKRNVLLFHNQLNQNKEIIEEFNSQNFNIINVYFCDSYKKVDNQTFYIKNKNEDYKKLLNEISINSIDQIIHLFSLNSPIQDNNIDLFNINTIQNLEGFFYLFNNMISKQLKKEIELIIVSDYVNSVTNKEKLLNPHSAAIFGFGKVINKEFPKIKCRMIDIDENTTPKLLVNEITNQTHAEVIAIRDGKRFISELNEIDINSFQIKKSDLKNDGIYLITGGLGGLGLEIADYILSQSKVNIALLSRSGLPDQAQWDLIIKNDSEPKLVSKLKKMKEILKKNSDIKIISADVSDYKAMEKVFINLKQKYKNINGIIHVAGIAGNGFLMNKDITDFKNVLLPKINGAWILNHFTQKDKLDFFILFSSISSLIGLAGQADYIAANAFLDSYCYYLQKKGINAITINWAPWRDTGMAFDYNLEDNGIFKMLPTNIALDMFDAIFQRKLSKIIIGEINYSVLNKFYNEDFFRLSNFHQKMLHKLNTGISRPLRNKERNIVLKGKEQFTNTEIKVGNIWGEILGESELNVYSDFNSLGGDSIIATQLSKKLEDDFTGIIDITNIFSYPSIYELSKFIDSQKGEENYEDHNIEKEKYNENLTFNDNTLDSIIENLANGSLNVDLALKKLNELK